MRLLGNFLLICFLILAGIFGVAIVLAILADVYTHGGPKALVLALVILAAFAALLIALRLRNRGADLHVVSRFATLPRIERWFLIAAYLGVTAVTLKAGWNSMTDPPGVIRPCAFCSPYVPYQAPEPPPREPRK
jgi:hypothetical protein